MIEKGHLLDLLVGGRSDDDGGVGSNGVGNSDGDDEAMVMVAVIWCWHC